MNIYSYQPLDFDLSQLFSFLFEMNENPIFCIQKNLNIFAIGFNRNRRLNEQKKILPIFSYV